MDAFQTLSVSVIVCILFAFIVKDAALAVIAFISGKKLSHSIRIEKTRSHFALLRHDLLDLTRRGGLDSNSVTFQTLYLLSTKIMRSPDRYHEISDVSRKIFFLQEEDPANRRFLSVLRKESETWNEETSRILFQLTEGLFMILIDYSLLMRFLFNLSRIVKRISPSLPFFDRTLRKAENLEKKRHPFMRNIVDVKNELLSFTAVESKPIRAAT